ncbi:MAG: hypothetical protein HKN85_11630 [Gammaproteobacteria bacterium]|nr:hypothetical protein [Gammaproteobacteria bacterium]
MPEIIDLRLTDSGRRRSASFRLSGTIVWQPEDVSRNGAEVLVTFMGRDRGADDLVWNYVLWVYKGGTFNEEYESSRWQITADGPGRSQFVLTAENNNDLFPRRRFNEDVPGRDEIYADVVLRDSDGMRIADAVRSNVVTGRY